MTTSGDQPPEARPHIGMSARRRSDAKHPIGPVLRVGPSGKGDAARGSSSCT